jgi:hypothetical protein
VSETVDVEVEVPADDTPPDTGDTVVVAPVVESGGDDGADLETGVMLGNIAARLDAIEARLPVVEADAQIAQSTADMAVDIADTAGETAATVAEDVATDSELAQVEEDVPPAGKPWFAKSASELFRKA